MARWIEASETKVSKAHLSSAAASSEFKGAKGSQKAVPAKAAPKTTAKSKAAPSQKLYVLAAFPFLKKNELLEIQPLFTCTWCLLLVRWWSEVHSGLRHQWLRQCHHSPDDWVLPECQINGKGADSPAGSMSQTRETTAEAESITKEVDQS